MLSYVGAVYGLLYGVNLQLPRRTPQGAAKVPGPFAFFTLFLPAISRTSTSVIHVTPAPAALTMERMSGPHIVRGSVSLPEAELIWRFSRSSGPGGQHVNTSDTQVELRFDLARTESLPPVWKERALERLAARLVDGVIVVRASEHRSQWRNREAAAVRLASLLAEATAPPPKPRRATRIPRGINERRLREKKARAETKKGRSGKDW